MTPCLLLIPLSLTAAACTLLDNVEMNSGESRHCQVVFTFNNHASIKMSNASVGLILFIMLKRARNKFFKVWNGCWNLPNVLFGLYWENCTTFVFCPNNRINSDKGHAAELAV